METLTSEEPESADAWFARAMVAVGADSHEEAVDAARRASNLRPRWNLPRLFLIQLLLKHGDREQARDELEPYTTGRPRMIDLREVLNAIFYLNKTGCPWRYLPKAFLPCKLINYIKHWKKPKSRPDSSNH